MTRREHMHFYKKGFQKQYYTFTPITQQILLVLSH